MKPYVHRLPVWLDFERPWMVITMTSVGWFPDWATAYDHARHIA